MTSGGPADDPLREERVEAGTPEDDGVDADGAGGADGADDGAGAQEPPLIDPPLDVPLEPPGDRRYPSTIGGACYLALLLTSGVGLAIVVGGDWRLGVRWLAGSLLAASALRLVLPQRDAGMLAVRHRLVDCTLLAGVGAALLFLAETIPDQPV